MGIDARIDIELSVDSRDHVTEDLARRLGGVVEFCDYRWLPSNVVQFDTLWRYWGPGYERGPWPEIRAVLAILLNWKGRGRIANVWYYGDTVDHEDVRSFPLTPEALAELDDHFANGLWTYCRDWRPINGWGHVA